MCNEKTTLPLTPVEPFILSLQKIPELIRVEMDEQEVLLIPVVPAQLRFESLMREVGEGNTEALLVKICEWVWATFHRNITTTQAWDLIAAVRTGFELHKKKLVDTLTLVSGSLASTLSESPEKKE